MQKAIIEDLTKGPMRKENTMADNTITGTMKTEQITIDRSGSERLNDKIRKAANK